MKYTIRTMQKQEYPLLENFLYEAIFIPNGVAAPPKNIIFLPELQTYIQNFGSSESDFALVAETENQIAGAVWVRMINDYGHINDITPSLAFSLYKEYHRQGIGSALLKEMLSLLKAHGYPGVSLSVQKANYAAQMYLKSGFGSAEEKGDEWIMVCHL